ncbi:sulfatase [Echinicola rosea]|uniref:Iduronate-2-sulfatase n=1 Tax=Echinicola rosea TaxID=1807691 RepID=A0ABQ1UXF6_9BACT|nr:sulfatase [Echinicola rosea]GGF27709.1 iduronate-2-sulfatase [Echinicola rosea]
MRSLFHVLLVALVIAFSFSCTEKAKAQTQPNILFIAVDDLRPELGCYGKAYVHSPHLDQLAAESSLFENHYVTVPTCGASRYNLITGLLPKSPGDLSNQASASNIANKPAGERPLTFIQELKQNGYYTVGIGKISHHPDGYVYGYRAPKSDKIELPGSWDEMLLDAGKWETGHNAFFGYADGTNRNDREKQVKPYEAADVEDEGYPDGLTANLAIKKLKQLKEKGKPFFMGVGFFKPHLPFTAPKKYWDLYNEEDIPLAPFAEIPENSSKASLQNSGELNQYKLGEEKPDLDSAASDAYARKLRHGYLAAVSYIDAQIGKILDELEEQGLAENTIVVVWGDHGWHLGDQKTWGKHTVFDNALQSVLLIKRPGEGGQRISQVVSTTDIYPTVMELTHVPSQSTLDGESMVSLMDNPAAKEWRNTAYSYFRRGVSLRTPQYRLTKYFREQSPAIELYDHQTDPYESENVAKEHPKVVKQLMPSWEKGNTGIFEE